MAERPLEWNETSASQQSGLSSKRGAGALWKFTSLGALTVVPSENHTPSAMGRWDSDARELAAYLLDAHPDQAEEIATALRANAVAYKNTTRVRFWDDMLVEIAGNDPWRVPHRFRHASIVA